MLPATTDELLFDSMRAGDLLRYSRVSSQTQYAVQSYIRRTFRLERILAPYFKSEDEILQFRFFQQRTGMILSGSSALQFFDRTDYPESDLDLYVPIDYAKPIAAWLKNMGYRLISPLLGPDQTMETWIDEMFDHHPMVLDFDHTRFLDTQGYERSFHVVNLARGNSTRKLQLIITFGSPLQSVLRFHSTCVMNFITHDKAYCLYPLGTLQERRAVITTGLSENDPVMHKYADRGWTMFSRTTPDMMDEHSAFASGTRRVGDSRCWTLPILPILDYSKPTRNMVEANTWKLRHFGAQEPEIQFKVLVGPNLEHTYLVSDSRLQDYLSLTFNNDEISPEEEEQHAEFRDEYLETLVKHYMNERNPGLAGPE